MKIIYSSHQEKSQNSVAPQLQENEDSSDSIPPRLVVSAFAVTAILAWIAVKTPVNEDLTRDVAVTLSIFVLAIWAWIFTPLADTYVSVCAAIATVLTGVLTLDAFTGSLGNQTIWLLLVATVIAHAVSAAGLAQRASQTVLGYINSTRGLFYALAILTILSAYFIPSTSGRAALFLPIFLAVAHQFYDRPSLIKALSLLLPSVILLSAVSSYLGAGAHLITDEILRVSHQEPIGFIRWMMWGSFLGWTSSLLCTELVLRLFLTKMERRETLHSFQNDFSSRPWTPQEKLIVVVLVCVVLLWSTEAIHGMNVLLVAIIAALVVTAPGFGGPSLNESLRQAPWPLLIFMASTLVLGKAIIDSGAAAWLGDLLFAPLTQLGAQGRWLFLVVVIVISTISHLVIQSRSARSAVLIPLVISAAIPLGVNPQAAAFISTAAAGFCHTLTSSAKPVALFSQIENQPVYQASDLLKLSLWLAPLHSFLVGFLALTIWPLLGLDFFSKP